MPDAGVARGRCDAPEAKDCRRREAPEIDPAIDESIRAFIAKKKAAVPDSNV